MPKSLTSWLIAGLYRSPAAYRAVSELGFAGYWRTWQRLALHYVPKGRLLDLGCGLGDLTIDAAKSGWTAVGVDVSWPMLESAWRRRGDPPRSLYAGGDASGLPFLTSTFDAVTITFPTEEVLSPRVARELARVLTPKGFVAIVLGATLRPTSFYHRALLNAQRAVYGHHAGRVPRSPPPLPFEVAGFKQRYIVVERSDWTAWLVVLTRRA